MSGCHSPSGAEAEQPTGNIAVAGQLAVAAPAQGSYLPRVKVGRDYSSALGLESHIVGAPFPALSLSLSLSLWCVCQRRNAGAEEIQLRRFPHPHELAVLGALAALENFGYRELSNTWRLQGWWQFMRKQHGWGTMTRKGFTSK
jgi:hypothetical protein